MLYHCIKWSAWEDQSKLLYFELHNLAAGIMTCKERSLTSDTTHLVAEWKVCLLQWVKAKPICHHLPPNGSVLMVGGRHASPFSFHNSWTKYTCTSRQARHPCSSANYLVLSVLHWLMMLRLQPVVSSLLFIICALKDTPPLAALDCSQSLTKVSKHWLGLVCVRPAARYSLILSLAQECFICKSHSTLLSLPSTCGNAQ